MWDKIILDLILSKIGPLAEFSKSFTADAYRELLDLKIQIVRDGTVTAGKLWSPEGRIASLRCS